MSLGSKESTTVCNNIFVLLDVVASFIIGFSVVVKFKTVPKFTAGFVKI